MRRVAYPAIVEAGAAGFGVFFPDLPGCTSGGDTVEAARRNAEVALAAHLALLREAGATIPAPSPMDAAARDADVREVARIMVPAGV